MEDKEFKALEEEIKDAHKALSKYVSKEHWSIAGRVDGLISMLALKFIDLAYKDDLSQGNSVVIDECIRLIDLARE